MQIQLLNCKQLAAEMGRDKNYISAMKSGGYRMKYGTKDTLANALKWLAANPGWRSTAYHRPRTKKSSFAKI